MILFVFPIRIAITSNNIPVVDVFVLEKDVLDGQCAHQANHENLFGAGAA